MPPSRRSAFIVITVVALVAPLLVLPGCNSAPPLLPPPGTEPLKFNVAAAEGRSPDLASGNYRATWIWRDPDGSWHLRTIARRVGHRFQGVIRPLSGGEIVDVKPISLDPNDRLGLVGRALSFDWETRRKIDGFDFRLKGDACLEFDLRLDGDAASRYIYLGKNKVVPNQAHFLICPDRNP